MTDYASTETFFDVSPLSATAGGASITGFSDTDAVPLRIKGVIGSTTPTPANSAIQFAAAKKLTTGDQILLDTEQVFQFLNYATPIMTGMGSGRIGIGTTAPDATVEINAAAGASLRLSYNDSNGSAANKATLTSGVDDVLSIAPVNTTVATAGNSASALKITGTITEAASGLHARMDGVSIAAPTITAGVATVTDSATVYIAGAPTVTTTGAPVAALFVNGPMAGGLLPESWADDNGAHTVSLITHYRGVASNTGWDSSLAANLRPALAQMAITFVCEAAQTIVIEGDSAETIADAASSGTTVTLAATINNYVTLICLTNGKWIIVGGTGYTIS